MIRWLVLVPVFACACGALPPEVDAGTPADAGPDAGLPDAGQPDAGADAGGDAGAADAGEVDAGPVDAGFDLFTPPPEIAIDVKQGDKGLTVGQLQFELKLATLKNLDEDGDFGPATVSLLNSFQLANGLPASTTADAATRTKLAAKSRAGALALIRVYPVVAAWKVPPLAEVAANVGAVQVIAGQGDKTATYMGRVGFAWGDGAEGRSIRQGSPAHVDWVCSKDSSASERRVIGVISRNEGPFDAVNSYDAGNYTWGAYQLIGSYRASVYNPSDDELGNGLSVMKSLDPESFYWGFQRFGIDATGLKTTLDVSLLLADGTTLHGKTMWDRVGTTPLYNQIFINAGQDPRIHRTEVLSARAIHFDALALALGTGRPAANKYLTSERAVTAYLDMELNRGRGTARNAFVAAIDFVAAARGIDATTPDLWLEADRTQIEAAVLQKVLTDVQPVSAAYYARFQRVLASVFIADAARSYVP